MKLKDWSGRTPFTSTPWYSAKATRPMSPRRRAHGCLVLDAASLGGADHRTPLFATPDAANVRFSSDGIATWRDPAGTRWILAEVERRDRRVQSGRTRAARLTVERAWTSRNMPSPRTPIIVNGVVFALGRRQQRRERGALCARSGLRQGTVEQRNDDHVAASAGLSSGTGQVYVVTADNTVYAFGIPLAIN